MKISNSCQLIGFTNLGEVNDQLDKVGQLCSPSNCFIYASIHGEGHVFQLGISICSFSNTGSTTADSPFPLAWEAVQWLGFRVAMMEPCLTENFTKYTVKENMYTKH